MGRTSKSIILKNNQSHIPFILIAIGFAILIVLSKVGIDAINPLNDQWLMTSGSDWTPDYMAWGFYRNAEWNFPLGVFTGYSFPEQVSIGLTGAIPLVAVPLKILDPILPDQFQHFGLWLLLCYILQAIFSYHLLRLWGIKDRMLLALGSCMFVISYTLLDRIAHTNLCAHWEILAGLCLYFSPSYKNSWWKHGLIIFASIWTHPYLIVFTIFIAWADFLKIGINHKVKITQVAFYFVSSLLFAAGAWYLIGNHVLDSEQARGSGFGVFSANLNTFFTPKTDGGIMPALPRHYSTQYEGVAYLGIGVLVSLLFFPYLIYKKKTTLPSLNRLKWPIIILATGMFFFSLSNQICINEKLLLHYKLPEWAMDKAAILRASGRYIWLIHYLILGSFVFILSKTQIKAHYKYAWLIAILLINIADFWPQIKPNDYTHTYYPVIPDFDSNFWNEVISEAEDFIMYPAHNRNYKVYADDMAFAKVAMLSKQKFNSGHLARFNSELRDWYRSQVQDTLINQSHLYSNKTIVSSKKYLPQFSDLVEQGNHELIEVNEYFAFVPKNGNYIKKHGNLHHSFKQDSLSIRKEKFWAYSQRNKNNYLLIAVKDEASNRLKHCSEIVKSMKNSGSKLIDLNYRESYIAIMKGEELIYEAFGRDFKNSSVQLDTTLQFQNQEKLIEIFSADMDNGNEARIFVEGVDYSINDRGLNIVSLDEQGNITETTCFDTYQQCHHQSEKSSLYYDLWRKE